MEFENVKEEYVTLAQAKILKKKGFFWDCNVYYVKTGFTRSTHAYNWNSKYYSPSVSIFPRDAEVAYSCPTHQMVLKWFREVHGIVIELFIRERGKRASRKLDESKVLWKWRIPNQDGFVEGYGDTYEKVASSAIDYVLTNLI